MTILTRASDQWYRRPPDERFTSLLEMTDRATELRAISQAITLPNNQVQARPVEDDVSALVIVGPDDAPVVPTHWAFGQLCGRAEAPAAYLRQLPPDIAADCLNHSLAHRRTEELGFLLRKEAGAPGQMHAATGPQYGRIWNAEILRALVARFGDGISGRFRVPGEFGKRVEVTTRNTTLYMSDRDMFVFLADEENRIEVPDRRNGQAGSMARGFFVWNSEVGSATLGVATFLFDYVCLNRIVWGVDGYSEIRIRHSPNAPHRWLDDIVPAIQNFAEKDTVSINDAIAAARSARLDEDEVEKVLVERFTRNQAKAIKIAHMADEGRPIESLWDVTVGATAYARNLDHQDARVTIERTAGRILTSASK